MAFSPTANGVPGRNVRAPLSSGQQSGKRLLPVYALGATPKKKLTEVRFERLLQQRDDDRHLHTLEHSLP
jgi:hypothetical protein